MHASRVACAVAGGMTGVIALLACRCAPQQAAHALLDARNSAAHGLLHAAGDVVSHALDGSHSLLRRLRQGPRTRWPGGGGGGSAVAGMQDHPGHIVGRGTCRRPVAPFALILLSGRLDAPPIRLARGLRVGIPHLGLHHRGHGRQNGRYLVFVDGPILLDGIDRRLFVHVQLGIGLEHLHLQRRAVHDVDDASLLQRQDDQRHGLGRVAHGKGGLDGVKIGHHAGGLEGLDLNLRRLVRGFGLAAAHGQDHQDQHAEGNAPRQTEDQVPRRGGQT